MPDDPNAPTTKAFSFQKQDQTQRHRLTDSYMRLAMQSVIDVERDATQQMRYGKLRELPFGIGLCGTIMENGEQLVLVTIATMVPIGHERGLPEKVRHALSEAIEHTLKEDTRKEKP